MKSAVSLMLIVTLSGSTLPLAAQGSGDSDWSRACELVAGTEVIVTVQGYERRPRYVVSCDESSLMVLNVSEPAFSADARRVLVEAASNHPDYFVSVQTRGTFILDKNVRLTPDGVFVADQKLADLRQVIETISRTDLATGVASLVVARPGMSLGRQIAITTVSAVGGFFLVVGIYFLTCGPFGCQ